MEGEDDTGSQSLDHQHVQFKRVVQYWMDKSTIHIVPRWCLFAFLLVLFFLRIYYVQGYFIVAYGLGIFLLNNFIAFLSPLEDPSDGGPGLPTTEKEGKEYRPFARRLPEFKFCLACTRGTFTSIVMTFFSVFDIPVFWPILLMYFFVLFFMTMKRQIVHMYKHKYVPISWGKSKYKDSGVENNMFGGGMAKSRWKLQLRIWQSNLSQWDLGTRGLRIIECKYFLNFCGAWHHILHSEKIISFFWSTVMA